MVLGYWNDTEATAETFVEGWLKSCATALAWQSSRTDGILIDQSLPPGDGSASMLGVSLARRRELQHTPR